MTYYVSSGTLNPTHSLLLIQSSAAPYWPSPVWRRHRFFKCCISWNWFRRHLWTDVYKTLTRDVYRLATEQYGDFLDIVDPKNLGGKNYQFSTTSQLNGNSEREYLGRGTWYWQSVNGVGNYEGSPTSSQNFMNFGPLTAKNRTIVFTHPLKSSCAWRRWPSCWPAVRHANHFS